MNGSDVVMVVGCGWQGEERIGSILISFQAQEVIEREFGDVLHGI